MKLTIGADPELFIFDKKLGKLISAAGLFPGTKEEPYKVEHGAVQVDGMAAEYNILPASNKEEFVFYNLSVLRSLRDLIQERNPDLEFEFRFDPVADFGVEYIAQQPEEARRLGCTPDFNAWENGVPNPTPDADMPFRTASGHIHLGWTEGQDINDPEFIEACCMMAMQLDCQVAPYTMNWEGPEGHRRRELYGKAGAFRPKPYGVEYRTPSNSWLNNVEAMGLMFQYTFDAFESLLSGYRQYEQSPYNRDRIRKGINERMENYMDNEFLWNYRLRGSQKVTMDTLDLLYVAAEHNVKNARPRAIDVGIDQDPGPVGFDEDDDDLGLPMAEPGFIEQPALVGQPAEWAFIDIPVAPIINLDPMANVEIQIRRADNV